jgi:hypothetical protein
MSEGPGPGVIVAAVIGIAALGYFAGRDAGKGSTATPPPDPAYMAAPLRDTATTSYGQNVRVPCPDRAGPACRNRGLQLKYCWRGSNGNPQAHCE